MGRTDGQTDGWTDRQTYGTDRGNTKCPSAILRIGGGIKKNIVILRETFANIDRDTGCPEPHFKGFI